MGDPIKLAPQTNSGMVQDPTIPKGIRLAQGAYNAPGLQAAPAQEVVSDASNYDTGYVQAFGDRTKYRSEAQSGFQMWRNALTQGVIGEVGLGTIEGIGYLADLEQWGNILQGTEEEYGNWLSDIAKKGKEAVREGAPVFQPEESIGWAPQEAEWWASNAPSILSSVSLLIPARGAAALAGKGASALSKGLRGLGVATQTLGKASRELSTGVSTAMFSRYMENTMEAAGVMQQTYQEALAKGMSDEEAKRVAGEAASTTWYSNLVNLGTDILQYTSLMRGLGKVNRGKMGAGAILGEVGKQVGSEAIEEAEQSAIGQEAKAAALGGFDPYGAGFGERLNSYLEDPDLQTAAFFGGLGGAVFAGVGAYQEKKYQPKFDQVAAEALAKERATAIGDKDKAKKLDDITFSRLAFNHLAQNSTDVLKDDLNQLKSDVSIEPEVRKGLEDKIKNLEFIEQSYDKLRNNPEIPANLIFPTLGTQLDIKLTSEDLMEMKNKTHKQIQEVLSRGEIQGDVVRIKEIEHTLKAYENLQAKSKKDFSEQIKFYDKLLWDTVGGVYQQTDLGKRVPFGMLTITSQDNQIQDDFNKMVAQQERLNLLKTDLAKLTTAEGRATAQKEIDEKKELDAATKLANNPKTSVPDLEKALAAATTPAAQQILSKVLDAAKGQAQKTNQNKTEKLVEKAKEAPAKKVVPKPKPSRPDITNTVPEPDVYEPEIVEPEPDVSVDDFNLVFGPKEDAADIVPGLEATDVPVGTEANIATIENGKLVVKRLQAETPTKPAEQTETIAEKTAEEAAPAKAVQEKGAKTILKEYAGDYNTDGVFIVEMNPDTTPKIQDYYLAEDKKKSNPIAVYDVFESSRGILTVNTPNIKVGDNVVIQVEPNWAFWKTNDPESIVMNVYAVGANGKAKGGPLTQIPSAKNPRTSTPESNALRKAIIDSGKTSVRTKVTYKNLGDLIALRNQDGTRLQNSLRVLEKDMHQSESGTWQVATTEHNPILAYVDNSRIVQAPSIETMKGLTPAQQALVQEMDARTIAQPGTIMALRVNPSGGYGFAQLDPRKLTKEETDWLHANLAEYLFDKRYADLKTLLNIEQAGIDENLNVHSNPTNPKLVIVAGDAAFEATVSGTKFWIKINATGQYGNNFKSFMEGGSYSFQVYDSNGVKKPDLQNSQSLSPQVRADIQSSFEKLLGNSFKNIDKNFLNTEGTFIDVLGKEYKSYYEYLVQTASITTDLPEGFSYANATIYLSSNIETTKTTVEPITKEVTSPVKPEKKQSIVSPSPQPKLTRREELVAQIKEQTSRLEYAKGRVRHQTYTKMEADLQKLQEELANLKETKKTPKKKIDWDNAADEATDTRYRLVGAPAGAFKVISQKELDWMQDKFGTEYLSIAQGVDRVLSHGGLQAFGYYHNAHITLAQFGEEGTGYHEAFHFIFNTQLTPAQAERIMRDAAKVYGNLSKTQLEEAIAEDFRTYMLSDGNYTPAVPSSRSLFQRIMDYIRKALGFKTSIERLFENSANFKVQDVQVPSSLAKVDDLRNRLVSGFQRVNQQIEALNDSTQRILNKAMMLGEANGVGFDDILESPDNINTILGEILNEYKVAQAAAEQKKDDYENDQIELAPQEIKDLALQSKTLTAILDNWEDKKTELNNLPGYKTTLIQNLGKYGFSVKIKEVQPTPTTEDEDTNPRNEGDEYLGEDDKDPNAQERIHGVSFLLQSPLRTLSAKIKRFLATIPEYQRNEDGTVKREGGKPQISATLFGTPKFVDFNRVYSNLSSKLAGSKNMYLRLSDLALTDPIAAAVKDQLDQHIQLGQSTIDPIPAQFFTTFNRSKYRFFTTLVGYENGSPTARVIETDRRNIERTLVMDWEANAIRKDMIDTDGTVNVKKAQKLLDELQKEKAKGSKTPYEENRTFLQRVLSDLGIDLPSQVWEKLDKSRKRSQDVAQMIFGDKGPTLEAMLQLAVDNINPYEEEGLVKQLAIQSKDYVDDLQAKTFINEKGNQVSAINLNTYVTDLIAELTSPNTGKEKVSWFQQDNFYKGNQFLEALKNSQLAKQVQVNVFSAYRDGTTAQPKEYGDTTEQDSFASRLTAWFNNGAKANSGYIYLGTLSDKSQQLAILLPKKRGDNAKAFLRDVLRGTVDQEIARIQRLRKQLQGEGIDSAFSPNLVATYGVRGQKFLYIDSLNQIPGLTESLTDGDIDPERLKEFEGQINEAIDNFITREEDGYYSKLKALGLIGEEKGRIVNLNLPDALEQAGNLTRLLSEFFYNDFAWRTEMSKVLHGDIAYYKNAETYFKRGYQLITPGLQGYYNPNIQSAGKETSYTRGIFASSIKQNSPGNLLGLATLISPDTTFDDITSAIGGNPPRTRGAAIASRYATVNKTDAQSYCRIHTYRDIALSVGMWTNDHELLYNIAWRQGRSVYQAVQFSKFSPEQKEYLLSVEQDLLLQPLKPFTYGDRVIRLNDGSTMILKEQFKESITPLLPQWANKHTEFKKLLDAMERDNIDIISDSEAVKVGSYAVNTDLSQPIVGREVPATSLRFPFFIPEKAKKEILAGTQIEKLIVGNIDPATTYEFNGKTYKGDALIQEYHQTWHDIIKEDYEDFKSLFKLEDNLRVPESRKLQFVQDLKKVLLEELSHRELPDAYYDSLLVIKNKLDQPEFMVGLDFPALGKKYEQILTGLFKKKLMTQKLPGDSLINLADFGISSAEAKSELKFIRNSSGKIVEAEVGVPQRFVKGLGIKPAEVTDPETGKILWDKLTPEQQTAMQLIIYRIPTQGKNSMIPCRIAFILPESAGSVIMIPGEMTKQGGMDFDVDKSYVMKRTSTKGKIDDTLPNKLFNIHWSILTNVAHAEELLNPLDSVVHDEMIAYLSEKGVVSRDVKNSPFSVATDLEMEKLAKYSKAMIGIFSKFSVGHATLQAIPDQATVKTPILITNKEYKYNQLGRRVDDSGILISDNHSAQQNSALDAQKDPKLGYLNITTFNANTLAYMTDLGVNQKLALSFMNQPVLRELSDEYFKLGTSRLKDAVNAVAQKHTGMGTLLDKAEKSRITEITAANLDTGLTESIEVNLNHQAQVLYDFTQYYFAGQDMAKVNTALSTDTVRDFTSIAAIQAFVDNITHVTSKNSKVELNPDIFSLSKSKVKRVAAFYNYGIRAALQFTKQFYPYNSEAFTAVRSEIAKATLQRNDQLRDKDDILAIDHAMTYYMFGENQQLEKTLSNFSSNYQSRWTYFTPSKSLAVHIEKLKNKTPRLKNNLLLQALRQEETSKRDTVQLVGLNNTHGNFNKTNLMNAWWDLMTDSDPEVKTLGYDLVRYAIQTSGFKTTPSSFIDIVPAEFWRESGLAPYHSSLSSAYSDNAKTVEAGEAAKVVIRHIFASTNIVKSIPVKIDRDGKVTSKVGGIKNEGSHIKEFTATEATDLYNKDAEREWAQFARIFDRKARRWRLYERQGTSKLYREIQPLGENNKYVEYTTNGDKQSSHPLNAGLTAMYAKGAPEGYVPFQRQTKWYEQVGIHSDTANATDVLTSLVNTETDEKRKQVQQKLLDNVEKLKDLKINVGSMDAPWAITRGFYVPVENTITIAPYFQGPQLIRHIITHELIHAYGARVVAEPQTQLEQNFVTNLTKLWEETKKHIPNDTFDDYGMSSLQEFIAELASNPEFRDRVRTKPGLWQRIVRTFRRLLGLNDSYDTIIDQFYDVLDQGENLQWENAPTEMNLKFQSKDQLEIEKIFKRVMSSLDKRLSRLKRTNKDVGDTEKTIKELTKLTSKKALVVYTANTIREVKKLAGEVSEALKQPDKLTARKLRQFREQLNSYKVLGDIRDHVYKHPEEYAEVKRENKSLLQGIDDVLASIRSLDTEIREASVSTVASWVKANTNQDMEFDDIVEQLKVADRDVSLINRGLDAIVDSRDAVLRVIGKTTINAKATAWRKTEKLLKEKWLDVNENYEKWLKTQGINPDNMQERHKPILDPRSFHKDSTFISFIIPASNEGRAIKALDKDHPLRAYYEMVVEGYLASQKTIPRHMRPGYRIPSVRRTAWERFTEEKGLGKLRVLNQGLIDNFRKTYDETDFQATDEAGNPIDFLPIRFISQQDGKEGRMSTREVSLDLSSTVLMFIDEMNAHDELLEIVHELELAKDVLASRQITTSKRQPGFSGLLSADRIAVVDDEGYVQTTPGITSNSYKQAEQFISRMVYGRLKANEGTLNLKGLNIDVAKGIDTLLRYTGIRMMAGNLNVVFSNIATGEATMLKEAVGGRFFTLKDWRYGKKKFATEVIPYAGEIGQRKKTSRFGAIWDLFNPEDQHRGNMNLGKDRTIASRILDTSNINFLNSIGTLEMNGSLMLAIMNQIKVQGPEGEKNLYEALEVHDGVVKVPKGYTINGKPLTEADLNRVRNKIISISQKMNGIYNTIDSSGIKAHAWGRLVLLMRNWLKPGIDARWRLQFHDERLGQVEEGYYISAVRFFKNAFGKDGFVTKDIANLRYLVGIGLNSADFITAEEKENLAPEEQKELSELRKANLKKTLFELYLILTITALAAFGWDEEDDKDSIILYHLVRLKRELSTFFSPTEAWSVLRSPTVALDTIQRLGQFVDFAFSAEGYEEYKQGPQKGEVKVWGAVQNKIPIWSQRNQFEDLDRKIDLIERGWK